MARTAARSARAAVLAALGPRMLDLARRRSRGAIPYFVPVEHTRFARERLGPDPVLAVQLAVVIGETRRRALDAAHEYVARYLPWPNYRVTLRVSATRTATFAGRGVPGSSTRSSRWGSCSSSR